MEEFREEFCQTKFYSTHQVQPWFAIFLFQLELMNAQNSEEEAKANTTSSKIEIETLQQFNRAQETTESSDRSQSEVIVSSITGSTDGQRHTVGRGDTLYENPTTANRSVTTAVPATSAQFRHVPSHARTEKNSSVHQRINLPEIYAAPDSVDHQHASVEVRKQSQQHKTRTNTSISISTSREDRFEESDNDIDEKPDSSKSTTELAQRNRYTRKELNDHNLIRPLPNLQVKMSVGNSSHQSRSNDVSEPNEKEGSVKGGHIPSPSIASVSNKGTKAEAKPKIVRRKRSSQLKPGQTAGRWTPEEHQAFLEGLKIYGREWKKVADRIPTRTSAQIRSHAQKYFAKISRDEQLLMQEHVPPISHQQPYGHHSHNHHHHNHQMVAQQRTANAGTPSVQRQVQRILADPRGAEREVEDTLRRLRERYQQLQICLEETNRQRQFGMPQRWGRIVEDETSEDQPSQLQDQQDDNGTNPGNESSEGRRNIGNESSNNRKRSLEESSGASPHLNQDDLSSVSSAVSALSSRDLGDGELIALSVLGGSLPRSASAQDLLYEGQLDSHRNRGTDGSSSISGETTETDASLDNGSMKKQRFANENNDESDDSGGDKPPHNDGMVH